MKFMIPLLLTLTCCVMVNVEMNLDFIKLTYIN